MSDARISEFSVFQRVLRWSPVVAWMVWIFSASTDAMSAAHTSLYVEPFLRWLIRGISQQNVQLLHFLIRKAAHVSEYGVLAILLRHAIQRGPIVPGRAAYWRTMAIALFLATLYAATDEIHQAFVPSRVGSVVDVFIDAAGAVGGLAALFLLDLVLALRRPRVQREPRPEEEPCSL